MRLDVVNVVSETQKPPPHCFYGDSYERGEDPWHRDAFPEEFQDAAPNQGKRSGGWFLVDAFGNQIGFVPDGTVLN